MQIGAVPLLVTLVTQGTTSGAVAAERKQEANPPGDSAIILE